MRAISLCLLLAVAPFQGPDSRPASRVARPGQAALPSPISGFWELRTATGLPQGAAGQLRGYLAIGERHLSLHMLGPGADPAVPFFQSGFRTYRLDQDRLITTALIGAMNKENGDVVIENSPIEEVRVWERQGQILRIKKSAGEYLDFVRIE